ncbi:MAG: hypothetical protein ACK5LF_02710 [Bacteroides xylanisolvens]
MIASNEQLQKSIPTISTEVVRHVNEQIKDLWLKSKLVIIAFAIICVALVGGVIYTYTNAYKSSQALKELTEATKIVQGYNYAYESVKEQISADYEAVTGETIDQKKEKESTQGMKWYQIMGYYIQKWWKIEFFILWTIMVFLGAWKLKDKIK